MKKSSPEISWHVASTTKRLIRLITSLATFSGVLLNTDPSLAYYCGTTHNFIRSHAPLQSAPDDFMFAGTRDKAQEIESLGVFGIRLRINGEWNNILAGLGIYRVFVSHVFYGNKALEGNYIMFMRVQECEEYGCERQEKTLESIRGDASRFKGNFSENNGKDTPKTGSLSPPYRIYFLKRYNPPGSIDFGNANTIWEYLSKTFGLEFYQRVCGELDVENTSEDNGARERFRSIENPTRQ